MIESGKTLCELMSESSLLCCLPAVICISERLGDNFLPQCKCTPIKPLSRAVKGRGNGRIKTADIAARHHLHLPPLSIAPPVSGAERCLGLLGHLPFLYSESRHGSGANRIRTTARDTRRWDAYFRLKNIKSILSQST
jgi:hypothetical protein